MSGLKSISDETDPYFSLCLSNKYLPQCWKTKSRDTVQCPYKKVIKIFQPVDFEESKKQSDKQNDKKGRLKEDVAEQRNV
jgi:hypothetical protein